MELEEIEEEALCTAAKTPKNYSEQRRNTRIRREVSEKMGEEENLRGLRSLSERKFLLWFFLEFLR